jgi:hypothetical protein
VLRGPSAFVGILFPAFSPRKGREEFRYAAEARAAAFCKRQRFFVAAMILFMPSALIRRLGFEGSGAGSDGASISPLILAHRASCASAIFLRDAALNFLRLSVGASAVAGDLTSAALAGVAIPSICRSAVSARSMAVFCRSSWSMMPLKPPAIR